MSVLLTDAEALELYHGAHAHCVTLRKLKEEGVNPMIRESAAVSLPIAERALGKLAAVIAAKREGESHVTSADGRGSTYAYANRHSWRTEGNRRGAASGSVPRQSERIRGGVPVGE